MNFTKICDLYVTCVLQAGVIGSSADVMQNEVILQTDCTMHSMAAEFLLVSQTSIDSNIQMYQVLTCQTWYAFGCCYLAQRNRNSCTLSDFNLLTRNRSKQFKQQRGPRVIRRTAPHVQATHLSEISVSQLRLERRISVLSQHVQKFSGWVRARPQSVGWALQKANTAKARAHCRAKFLTSVRAT